MLPDADRWQLLPELAKTELAPKPKVAHYVSAEVYSREHKPTSPLKAVRRPSRNAPCPCASGKKYKVCCGGPRHA